MTFRTVRLALLVFALALCLAAPLRADPILLSESWTGLFVHGSVDHSVPGGPATFLFQDETHVPHTGGNLAANTVNSRVSGPFLGIGTATGSANVTTSGNGSLAFNVSTFAYGLTWNRSTNEDMRADVGSKYVAGIVLDKATNLEVNLATSRLMQVNDPNAEFISRLTLSDESGTLVSSSEDGPVQVTLGPGTYRLEIESSVKWTGLAGNTGLLSASMAAGVDARLSPADVPEPATLTLVAVGAGCAGLMAAQKRRRSTKQASGAA